MSFWRCRAATVARMADRIAVAIVMDAARGHRDRPSFCDPAVTTQASASLTMPPRNPRNAVENGVGSRYGEQGRKPSAVNASTAGFCSGGDACTNVCALQIKTCGSSDAPVQIGTTTITPQYQNMAACVAVCKNGNATTSPAIAPFDLTHVYATVSSGNSLACRLNHWTNAATQAGLATPNAAGVNTHCNHTGAAQTPGLPCSGTPAP